MNEQLQQAVAALIEKSLKAFEAGADFMAAEIPDVIHQLLMWHMVKSGVVVVLSIMLMIAFVTIDYKVFKVLWNQDHERCGWNDDFILGYLLTGSLARFVWAVPISMFNLTWLQIWIAPKVWLIEYAAKMIK